MRRSIVMTLCMVVLSAAAAYCGEGPSSGSGDFAFAGEDLFGGGSYLGVDTRDVTSDRLGPLQLKEETGVEVTMVDQDAPAGKAGIKEHDVILSVNGEKVESVEQLRRIIREIPGGRVVSIEVSRAGQTLTLKAQLAERKGMEDSQFKFVMPAIPPIPPVPPIDIDIPVSVVVVHSSARTGLMVENLTSQLADFFGAKNGHGVLVRSVEKGSAAEKAGFRAGDVITKVNGEAVSDSGDFSHFLRNGKNNTASVSILRDKKEQTLTLTVPQRSQSGVFEEESFDFPKISEATELTDLNVQLADIEPQVKIVARNQAQARQMQHAAHELNQQRKQMQQNFKKEIRLWSGEKADI